MQTYIVNGVRSVKSRSKAAFYRHGNLLDLVVYHRDTGNIMRVSEVKFAYTHTELPFQIVKSSLLLFYIELLNKTLKEQESNFELFNFLFESIVELDETDRPLGNHHIWFLLVLSKFLGFFPAADEGNIFDMQNGTFVKSMPAHQYFLNETLSDKLKQIIYPELINYDQIRLDQNQRKSILTALLTYYKLHIADFGEVKSLHVLEELFKD